MSKVITPRREDPARWYTDVVTRAELAEFTSFLVDIHGQHDHQSLLKVEEHRRFLDAYLPEIENFLHYRSVDVSSIKELVRRWYPQLSKARVVKNGTHRALDDIRESIAELQYYRDAVFRSRA